MSAPPKGLVASIVVLLVAAGFAAWYHYWSPWKADDGGGGIRSDGGSSQTSVIAVSDFDTFQKHLADRVSRQFGVDAASVVIAPAAYDLGWLLDSVQTYPADRTDCVPKPMPQAIAAPHLFPSYQLGSSWASTMTFGSEALQQLTNASLNVSHQANLVYSIDHVQVLLMDLKTVEEVSRNGACNEYVAAHPKSRLIRGVVLGKISFKFATDNPASAEAKLPKIGGISAKADPNNSTVTVTDDEPSQILEIVSILEMEPGGRKPASVTAINRPRGAAPPPNVAPAPEALAPGTPHIFLQQDAADNPAMGQQVAAQLSAQWPKARVETRVERVATSKMPSSPQIRFFNAADQDLANKCRDRLKTATGIDARVVRIGLAAPAGQMEVWLQKAATPQ